MFKSTELNFTIEGIKGDLKLVYNVIGQPKLYQNGQQLKKEGLFKMKFLVETTNPESPKEYLEIKRGLSFAFSAIYNGKETFLEEKLSTLQYIIGAVPAILLIFLGGVIGAVIGVLGVTTIFNFMRNDKRLPVQIVFAVAVTAICYFVYLALALLLGMLLVR